MYIVAIAWIYVIGIMAATEKNLVAGLATFLLFGVLPLAVMAIVFGRRRASRSDESADRKVDRDDGGDAERDQ